MALEVDRKELLKNALLAVEEMQARLEASEHAKREPIAVVGLSCRFPSGANSPELYWQLLRDGADLVGPVPPNRWPSTAYERLDIDPDKPIRSWQGGFLDQIDEFDAPFFGIIPREVNTMDPQQRLVLEVAWEALERAGIAADQLNGSLTGVFVGVTTSDYASLTRNVDPRELDVYVATGSALNVVAGRLAYTLGLQGPCMAVDTACSSSLVALHLACQSLRNGESNLAIAGGVNALISPEAFLVFNKWGMMASDGRCKTFDVHADGFVRSEGCGILVLKRLSDALNDGDHILGLIRGSAVNQDGRSTGLTAPNGLAQQQVIRAALNNAGVEPHEISYVEAHGTGTSLGDPIEVEAIGAVLREGRSADRPLLMGSVKTNIGHAESAAGVAGVIKTILAMQHGELPPHLHLTERNPDIPWPDFTVEIPTEPTPWEGYEGARLAGVSAFGFSGTNAHVILEAAPPQPPVPNEVERSYHVFTLSTRNEDTLFESANQMADFLLVHPTIELADAAYTSNRGRARFSHRLALTASTSEEAAAKLQAFTNGEDVPNLITGVSHSERQRIVFLFTGQGAQYVGMGRLLYETQPTFRATLDACDEILQPYLPNGLLPVLFSQDDANSLLHHTEYTQPALFAIEYALAQLWMSWGIQPHAVLGHSVGEFTAACIAGIFSLEDGLRLIAERGRLMGGLPSGGVMAAVMANETTVANIIQPFGQSVVIATLNGPDNTVISGEGEAVNAAVEALNAQSIKTRLLNVSHAFHSALMEPILPAFERVLKEVQFNRPKLKIAANVTGTLAGDELTRPDYWLKQARGAVRFSDDIQALYEAGYRTFLEIGPSATLISMGQRIVEDGIWLPSLRDKRNDWEMLLGSLSKLFIQGVDIDWDGFDRDYHRQNVVLPTYPFQRQRYWMETTQLQPHASVTPTDMIHPLLGQVVRSPLHPDVAYVQTIDILHPRLLTDHRIHGTVVFPGTGYFEMALAAGLTSGQEQIALQNVEIHQPLIIPDESKQTVQIVLSPHTQTEMQFQIFSTEANTTASVQANPEWKLHARGQIAFDTLFNPADAPALASLKTACTETVPVDSYYTDLDRVGLNYGDSFRSINALWFNPETNRVLGHIGLPDSFTQEADDFYLHPGMLDSCFHLLGVALGNEASDDSSIYLPIGMNRMTFYQKGGSSLWSYVELQPAASPQADTRFGDVYLYSDDGVLVAVLQGLVIRRANRQVLEQLTQSKFDDALYQLDWVQKPLPTLIPAPGGRWLILADQGGTGERLAAHLDAVGAPYKLAYAHELNLSDPNCFKEWLVAQDTEFTHIIHLWALNVLSTDIADGLQVGLRSAVYLTQASALQASHPKIWLITRDAQMLRPGEINAIAQTPIWGLGRVIAREHPDLWGGLLDIDATTQADQMLGAILADDHENQTLLRFGERYVGRLQHAKNQAPAEGQGFELALTSQGELDSLKLVPASRREPEAGEVEVRVLATGLNFRDVLNALGMYPGAAFAPGTECAGVVVRVGAGETQYSVGDRVLALTTGAFNSYVTVNSGLVFPTPENLTFAEAATIPSIFLTAYYGLHELAKMKPGDRVLIHAAAGGVGLAAVQLAQRAGAEVFATAGSEAKHAYLRSIGVQHIMSSRTLDFADEIMAITNGKGVDIVLNSLADDFIPKSLSVLAEGGCFLEIGKRNIWTQEEVNEHYPNRTYYAYDLVQLLAADQEYIPTLLRRLLDEFAADALHTPPILTFPIESVVDAFRYMARAKHIGKIVVTQNDQLFNTDFSEAGTYLITGGLGGLGLKVAEWFVGQGAKSVVLVGRNKPSQKAAEVINALEDAGARVHIIQADISVGEQATQLIDTVMQTMPPLRGIIHAAGVVDDGFLVQQDWSRFENVLAPKVAGAWHLHQLTRELPLDFFVLFSSGSAVFGSAGQSNYAAANAFLDGLALYRQAHGLPAQSINWGAWSEVGMASAMNAEQLQVLQQQGVRLIAPEQGVSLLGQLMTWPKAQVIVSPIDWTVWRKSVRGAEGLNFFSEVLPVAPMNNIETKSLPARGKATHAKRANFSPAEAVVADIWQQVMGIENFSVNDNFFDLGGNSLLAMEVLTRIKDITDIELEPTSVHLQTLGQLAARIEPAIPAQAEPHSNGKAPITPDRLLPSLSVATFDRETPILFGADDEHLFGMYYRPESETLSDFGVVICHPWGQEYIRSHRSCHQLALRLANSGIPALRFDYYGTGDSSGDDVDFTISRSVDDISLAVNELCNQSGVERVILVGLRLGASLAALASMGQNGITHVVLWDPVVNGDDYFREITEYHQRNLLYYLGGVEQNANPQTLEVLGFAISDAMRDELKRVNLLAADWKPSEPIMLIEREPSPATEQLRAQLENLNIALNYQQVDAPQIWTENTDKALVPHQTLEAIVNWIREQ